MYHLRKRSKTLVPDRSFAAVLRSYSHNVGRTEKNVARGTSASLLLDLPHARYHNHLINLLLLLLLLRILTRSCVCVRVCGALDFPLSPPLPLTSPLSTDFFISSSRSARTDFTASLSFLPLRVRPRHCRGYHWVLLCVESD